jgi:glycosyltransferase involved in cell wall biosynthesis
MPASELKVLLFSGRFEVRGSCAYTLRLAEHLPEQGVQVRVICPDARMVEPHRRAELSIQEYGQTRIPLWNRVVLQLLRRELALNPPDLIHLQSRSVTAQGTWLARKLERPCLLTVHDFLQPGETLLVDPDWCRRIIAVSESVKSDLLAKTSLPAEMVTVIHSGVGGVGPVAITPVLEAGHVPVVGAAGPLEAVKGFPFFLGAAQKVLATHRDVEFLVAGAGPEEGNLRRVARELGINEHVTFVSSLHDFSESLAAMDVFCLPSLQQGLGTIMLEAMALAKPVIATNVGGVHSIVRDGETGLLVLPSDSSQLAERILELLNDPVRARQIGAAARREVEAGFGMQKMVNETAALYRDVVEQHQTILQSTTLLPS